MSVTGVWKNSYGSVMNLTEGYGGWVSGQYSSTTGSSGIYGVVGWAGLNSPTSSLGQSLALSIYWRALPGTGTEDPSWHWVSGLSGQIVTKSGINTMYLMHAMVASDAFPDFCDAGTYLDKLTYLPDTSNVEEEELIIPKFDLKSNAKSASDPMDGTWVCREDSSIVMTMAVQDPKYGNISGIIALPDGGGVDVTGFTDTYAVQNGITLQSLSICAFRLCENNTMKQCISMAGVLDINSEILTLTTFTSQGTSSDEAYLQTTLLQYTFIKQS